MPEYALLLSNSCMIGHAKLKTLAAVPSPDLNLLISLDALLTERSVARAADRLRLSPSAMSRTLARLREVTGDPLLVRAGRGLVPTPRAIELQQEVGPLVEAANAVLRPQTGFDPTSLERIFTIRTGEGFAETFGPELLARIECTAPAVQLRFVPKPDRNSEPLRLGNVDLETGLIESAAGPELRVKGLYREKFVGVVRSGHAFAGRDITRSDYANARHVTMYRQGIDSGPVGAALDELGLERRVAASVGGFSAALALVRRSELVATVPAVSTSLLRDGMYSFELPFKAPEITVSLVWHPRMDADPAHRWLRQQIEFVCAQVTR